MQEVLLPRVDQSLECEVLSVPADIDLHGKFWAEPNVLADWINRINEVTLSTMSMGALTHEAQNQPLLERMVDIFDLEDKPVRTDVVNAGIMYGSLVARESAQLQGRKLATDLHQPDPQGTARAVGEIFENTAVSLLWKQRGEANYVVDVQKNTQLAGVVSAAFMTLREFEVRLLGSDILATTLAVAQDHILKQVYTHVDIDETGTRAAVSKDAQVLFYAGALAGALKYYVANGELPEDLPTIQLHRGIKDNDVIFGSIVEFESSDNVVELIRYALEHKYTFKKGLEKSFGATREHKVLGVFAGGVQTGPNGITLPLPGVTDFPWQVVEYRDIKHILLQRNNTEANTVEYKVVPADKNTWEQLGADEWNIAAIVCKDKMCISTIDIAHPSAVDIDTFMCERVGIKPGSLKYANELQVWGVMGVPRQLRNLGKVSLAAAVGPWVFEAVERYLLGSRGDLPVTVGASAVAGAIGLSTVIVKKILNKKEPLERYDRIIYTQSDVNTNDKASK